MGSSRSRVISDVCSSSLKLKETDTGQVGRSMGVSHL